MRFQALRWPVACFLGFLPAVIGTAIAQSPVEVPVVVEGRAVAQSGAALGARIAAIEDALRNAVIQVIGLSLAAETIVENYELVLDTVTTQASGIARLVSIIEEGEVDQGVYRVVAEVAVKRSTLADHLALAFRTDGLKRVVLVMNGEPGEVLEASKSAAERALLGQDYTVIDSRSPYPGIDEVFGWLALGADLVVTVQLNVVAQTRTPPAAAGLVGTTSAVTARALDPVSEQVVASHVSRVSRFSIDHLSASLDSSQSATSAAVGGLLADVAAWTPVLDSGLPSALRVFVGGAASVARLNAAIHQVESALALHGEIVMVSGATSLLVFDGPASASQLAEVLEDEGWRVLSVVSSTVVMTAD